MLMLAPTKTSRTLRRAKTATFLPLFLLFIFVFTLIIAVTVFPALAKNNAGGSLNIIKWAAPKDGADFSFFLSRYHSQWGTPGSEDGQFLFPIGTAVDEDGNVYVTDVNNGRIQKFDKNGAFLLKFGTAGSGDGQFDNPVGVAIDAQGNIYVVDSFDNRIQKFAKDGTYLLQWGSSGSDEGQFSFPSGIAVGPQGQIFVSDYGNNRIQVFENDGSFVAKWGQRGSASGQLHQPQGIAVNANGNVFVSELGNHRIQKFSSDGTYLAKWGSLGSAPGQFNEPYGLAVDSNGDLFVADQENQRIQRFDQDGTFLAAWGSEGREEGQFMTPTGVAAGPKGRLYVVERFNHRVQRFASTNFKLDDADPDDGDNKDRTITFDNLQPGEHILVERQTPGWQLEDLTCSGASESEISIDVDRGSATINLTGDEDITCTFANESLSSLTVVKSAMPTGAQDFTFDLTGPNYPDQLNFLTTWGSNGSEDGQFNIPYGLAVGSSSVVYVVDAFNYRIQMFDKTGAYLGQWGEQGSADGQLNQPWGIAAAQDGSIFVTDSGNRRIQKFTRSGAYLDQWGSAGSGDGQFDNPYGITLDAQDNIYVVDSGNHRLQKFDKTGAYLAQWGSQGSGDGQFESPSGIAIDSLGHIYVADSENHRVQIFDQDGTYLDQFGSNGSADGQFFSLNDIAVDSQGFIYVTDKYNHRIQKFDSEGNFIRKWGSFGDAAGSFERPYGIDISAQGQLYIVDSGNSRVQTFLPYDFTLDAAGANDGDTIPGQITFDALPTGSYQIIERELEEWGLGDLTCSGAVASEVKISLANRRAIIDLAPDEDIICTYRNLLQAPLLSAAKEDELIIDENDPEIANPGDTISYTVIIENQGGIAAESVQFSDYIESDASLSCDPPAAPVTSLGTVSSCTDGPAGSFVVEVGSLAAGEQVEISFETAVNEDASGIAICNQGQVAAANHDLVRTGDPGTADPADPTCTPLIENPPGQDIYLPIITANTS